MQKLYDGINTDAEVIAKIIQPGEGVAYYIDGYYAWNSRQIGLFPASLHPHVTITVLGNPADAGDCETGDMSPDGLARWINDQKRAGYWRPTGYRSFSLMQDIRISTGTLIMGRDWDSWVADYDNNPNTVYPGCALKQYRSTDNFDLSEVYDPGWPHRIQPKPPVLDPTPTPKWPAGVVLSFGMVGNAVHALQQALHNSGLYGVRGIPVDGHFGEGTRTAVHNFEAAAHLTQDVGIAGNQVRTALIHMGLLHADGSAA